MAGSKLGNAFRQRLAERKKPDAELPARAGAISESKGERSHENGHSTKKPEVEPVSLHPIDQSAAFFADEIAADMARDRQKRWKAARKKSRKHWAWRHRW